MNAIIIEDEVLIARDLRQKIEQVAPDLSIREILPSVRTTSKWLLENAEPDVIFADIQLSDGTSFEIFEKFDLKCPVIFVTAYDEYAIQAFKVNGIDYLLKPIDTHELTAAIDKCRSIVSTDGHYPNDIQSLLQLLHNAQPLEKRYREKFIVKHRGQWVPVSTSDIACFNRDQLNYIYLFDGTRYILDFTSLDEIEDLLDPHTYYRMNRQCILHIDAIDRIRALENQKLIVALKQPLKLEVDVSREKAPSFKKWLDR